MKIQKKTRSFIKDGEKVVERTIKREDGIYVKFIPPEHWWTRTKWELLEPYTSHNGEVSVPVGFVTDGASIAWPMQWLFSPTGSYFGAAIVHDYVLETTGDWKQANTQFEIEMEYLGVESWRKTIMVNAVKLWWWLKRLFGAK